LVAVFSGPPGTSKAVAKLRAEGREIRDEDIARLSRSSTATSDEEE
jgi:hypothetical protein